MVPDQAYMEFHTSERTKWTFKRDYQANCKAKHEMDWLGIHFPKRESLKWNQLAMPRDHLALKLVGIEVGHDSNSLILVGLVYGSEI